ncbi:MAG: ATP-binding protein [Burkholderiales bacterium]
MTLPAYPSRAPVHFKGRGTKTQQALLAIAVVVWVGLLAAGGEWAARREISTLVEAMRRSLEVQALTLRGTVARYKHIPFTSGQQSDISALLTAAHKRMPATDAQRDGDTMSLPDTNKQNPVVAQLLAASPLQETVDRVDVYLEDINRRVGSEALYLMDTSGWVLSASNWNSALGFKSDNYRFRPYFNQARAGGLGFFYAVGSTSGLPGLFFATPVQVGDTVRGVMAIKVTLSDVERTWVQAESPLFLIDKRGIVFLSSITPQLYTATRQLSDQDLAELNETKQYGTGTDGKGRSFPPTAWTVQPSSGNPYQRISMQIDGVDKNFLAIEEQLPEFDWMLMVTADLAPAQQARWITVTMGVLLSAIFLFGGLLWRQRETRMLELRRLRGELELTVDERTKDLADAASFRKAMEDSMQTGMRARDLEGRVKYVNPALCEITGYKAADLMERLPPYPYWHPEETEKHWADNEAALKGQAALTGYEARYRHANGHDLYMMVFTAPLIDASGLHTGWMSSMVDITPQKRAEEQHLQHAIQMQRTGRLANMGEMASTLAHELSQPLMALVNYSGAAKGFAKKGHAELLNETLSDISEQAQRAAEIISRIRGFVRQSTPGFQPCAINDIVNNVIALMRPEARHQKSRIVTHMPYDLPLIKADRVLLEQVILNLVLNAMQAMHDKFPTDRVVTIETSREGDRVCARVWDTGAGIGDDVSQALFQPFFTTKADGLGLGLNICRTTMELHGGRIEFANRPEGGAMFSIYIPIEP